MVIIYCSHVVTISYKIFGRFYPTILEWDFISQNYFTCGKTKNKYRTWIFIISVIFVAFGCGSCLFTVTHTKHFQIANVLFSGSLLPAGCFISECSLVLFLNVEQVVLAFRRMKLIVNATNCEGIKYNHVAI